MQSLQCKSAAYKLFTAYAITATLAYRGCHAFQKRPPFNFAFQKSIIYPKSTALHVKPYPEGGADVAIRDLIDQGADGAIRDLLDQQKSGFDSLLPSIPDLKFDLPSIPNLRFDSLLPSMPNLPSEAADSLENLLSTFLALPLLYKTLAIGLPTAFLASIFIYTLSHPPPNYRTNFEPYKRGSYDPEIAKSYYSKHPFLVLRRLFQLLRISNKFLFAIWVDNITKKELENRSKRAGELLDLIQNAGPTAIKVGQALSVRPDLIAYEYANALSTLQDRVPPFDSKRAKGILQEELLRGNNQGKSLSDIFTNTKSLDAPPVASASIGQVYKATLRDENTVVAIKIQRPDVLAEIALDLHLVREYLAPLYQKYTKTGTDYVSLANEWGRGFIAELDYNREMMNTQQFQEEVVERGLDNVLTGPIVVPKYCTEKVLVTEWVDGKRLDQTTADVDDVTRLCSVALNAYLVMLLEIGTLHCDPHPGNLLRTPEGKLCILDFGMTLQTKPTLQYDLLEFIAHLTARDYDKIPEDLVALGFLKADSLDEVKASGFLEPLTYLLQQASEGGGAEKVRDRIFTEFREKYPGLPDDELRIRMRADMKARMDDVREKESAISGITVEVEELQRRNREAFRIPEWFLYTSRAFLTLEGISLQADEDYSLIQSCFPYVAKRLLQDDSERAQMALRDLLYGAGQYVSGERLSDLADGFTQYTSTTKSTEIDLSTTNGDMSPPEQKKSKRSKALAETEATITLAKDAADILLSSEGNLVQNLLLNETAAAATASVKDTMRSVLIDQYLDFRKSLPFSDRLPPSLRERYLKPFLTKTEEEAKAQELIQNITAQYGNQQQKSGKNGAEATEEFMASLQKLEPEQVAMVIKELRLNIPRYAPLVGNLGGKFASTVLQRTNNDIEQTLSELELMLWKK